MLNPREFRRLLDKLINEAKRPPHLEDDTEIRRLRTRIIEEYEELYNAL